MSIKFVGRKQLMGRNGEEGRMVDIYLRRDQISQADEMLKVLRTLAGTPNARVEIVNGTFSGKELKIGSQSYKFIPIFAVLPQMVELAHKWNGEYGGDFIQQTVQTLTLILNLLHQPKQFYVGTPFPIQEIAVISESGRLNQPFSQVQVGSVYLSFYALGMFNDPTQTAQMREGFDGGGMWLHP